jgi:putative endonuclease
MWFAYAIRSMKDGWLYIGLSSNVEGRVKEHNAGYNRSTKSRRPFELVYVEQCDSRAEARAREKYLKSGIGREFLKGLSAGSDQRGEGN